MTTSKLEAMQNLIILTAAQDEEGLTKTEFLDADNSNAVKRVAGFVASSYWLCQTDSIECIVDPCDPVRATLGIGALETGLVSTIGDASWQEMHDTATDMDEALFNQDLC